MNLGQRILAYLTNLKYWVSFDAYVQSIWGSIPSFDPNASSTGLTPEQQTRLDQLAQQLSGG